MSATTPCLNCLAEGRTERGAPCRACAGVGTYEVRPHDGTAGDKQRWYGEAVGALTLLRLDLNELALEAEADAERRKAERAAKTPERPEAERLEARSELDRVMGELEQTLGGLR